MTSDELASALEEMPEEALPTKEPTRSERFFIFSVGESRFALPPSAIQEIVSDLEIFPLPACPPYVPGLINCHGTPFTVFDLRVLFESERQEATQFLVLKLRGDNVAFGCSTVDEIVEIPQSEIAAFADKDAESRYCNAIINLAGERIPVLSVEQIQQQLENDLA